ncbi:TetR/AcrR family transcriptional regulator [Sciscionella sediminilitoris]|uniref:TetR/AcrR family transcriptional regulator n=1 Tax=Sciscionella sediminilitoris TaxID=1445613 RepID=UPI0004DF80C0|nr:TetR/AcrR family transcriptional regulator [Sciscionella sp. SE31]
MAELADRRPPMGRPRTPGVDEAVIRATIRRFIEDGYTGMSLAKVAADAGTTRPSVYLRWPTKQALVVAAVRSTLTQEDELVPENLLELQPKKRLLRLLRHLRPSEDHQHRTLYATLLAESRRIPELLDLINEELVEPRTRAISTLLESMKERGEIRAGVNTEHAATMLYGVRFVDSLRPRPGTADPDRESVELLWPAIAAQP